MPPNPVMSWMEAEAEIACYQNGNWQRALRLLNECESRLGPPSDPSLYTAVMGELTREGQLDEAHALLRRVHRMPVLVRQDIWPMHRMLLVAFQRHGFHESAALVHTMASSIGQAPAALDPSTTPTSEVATASVPAADDDYLEHDNLPPRRSASAEAAAGAPERLQGQVEFEEYVDPNLEAVNTTLPLPPRVEACGVADGAKCHVAEIHVVVDGARQSGLAQHGCAHRPPKFTPTLRLRAGSQAAAAALARALEEERRRLSSCCEAPPPPKRRQRWESDDEDKNDAAKRRRPMQASAADDGGISLSSFPSSFSSASSSSSSSSSAASAVATTALARTIDPRSSYDMSCGITEVPPESQPDPSPSLPPAADECAGAVEARERRHRAIEERPLRIPRVGEILSEVRRDSLRIPRAGEILSEGRRDSLRIPRAGEILSEGRRDSLRIPRAGERRDAAAGVSARSSRVALELIIDRLKAREQARRQHDLRQSDRILDELLQLGVSVYDAVDRRGVRGMVQAWRADDGRSGLYGDEIDHSSAYMALLHERAGVGSASREEAVGSRWKALEAVGSRWKALEGVGGASREEAAPPPAPPPPAPKSPPMRKLTRMPGTPLPPPRQAPPPPPPPRQAPPPPPSASALSPPASAPSPPRTAPAPPPPAVQAPLPLPAAGALTGQTATLSCLKLSNDGIGGKYTRSIWSSLSKHPGL